MACTGDGPQGVSMQVSVLEIDAHLHPPGSECPWGHLEAKFLRTFVVRSSCGCCVLVVPGAQGGRGGHRQHLQSWFHQCHREGAGVRRCQLGQDVQKQLHMTRYLDLRSGRCVCVAWCRVVVGCAALDWPWVEVVPCQDVQCRSHRHCGVRTPHPRAMCLVSR